MYEYAVDPGAKLVELGLNVIVTPEGAPLALSVTSCTLPELLGEERVIVVSRYETDPLDGIS